MSNFVNISQVTNSQPFCAGVIILQERDLLVTLNTDGLPDALEHSAWRVGGVGGGQEPGETVWQCAIREGKEELSVDVDLLKSPVTFFHDIDTGELSQITTENIISPFLFERKRNPFPHSPYRPGLPIGPYIYFNLFFAKPIESDMRPGDDVVGLLRIPLEIWDMLKQSPTLEIMLSHGAKIIENEPLPRTRNLWLPSDESFSIIANLLKQTPGSLEKYSL